jgi:intracellular septation protein
MKHLFKPARLLLLDLASTLFFLALYALTGNITLAVLLGATLALAQIGWKLARKDAVDTLQWISLVLVLGSGTATLLTHNPLFVMLKPSASYSLVGWSMHKRGWMARCMPQIALTHLPDLVVGFGYVWAGMMFFSAGLNLVLAANLGIVAWGAAMSAWGIASKIVLFLIQYGAMRAAGIRRRRAREAPASFAPG